MMSGMRKMDVHDELQAAFEVSPLPPIGPDGAPMPPPMRAIPPPRPRLCEAGPCRNYHRFAIQLDAARPRARTVPVALPEGTPGAQAVPGGTVYQAPAAFHVQTHHYCYPTTGIEMPLGDLPVTECNRWDPIVEADADKDYGRSANRRKFQASSAGEQYVADVLAWERARELELKDDEDTEQLIADSLRVASSPKPEGDPR